MSFCEDVIGNIFLGVFAVVMLLCMVSMALSLLPIVLTMVIFYVIGIIIKKLS
jgi:hypothetical protein